MPDPRAPSGDFALAGEVANPADPPPVCYFHPRRPFVVDAARTERPCYVRSQRVIWCVVIALRSSR